MSKNFDYSSLEVSKELEDEMKSAIKIGEGHNGIVFLLNNNRSVKFFRRHQSWIDEAYILKRVRGSRFFPRVHEIGDNYIVRDYVEGCRLDKYLKDHRMDKILAKEIYDMIDEFSRLRFKRLDIRCKDLFYNTKTCKLMVIDPKKNYIKRVSYPRHLMKGLWKRGVLEEFLDIIKDIDREKAIYWKYKINRYLVYNKK
ncbi:hypothetical protein [Clostridium sp.]|uniref:hypothetical protein n=1 Tax=Clostridium sp. TaxID=1506 RepID=UPI003992B622